MTPYGLVLAGGAARGAYQVGVMRYVLVDLARELGRPTWPEMVSGTSVGALNGVFAAAQSEVAIERLAHLWSNLTIDQVYRLPFANMVGAMRGALGAQKAFALLDPEPFHQLVERRFPAGFLRRSIDGAHCRALILSATVLQTGYNALFVDSADPNLPFRASPDLVVHRTRIGSRHVLASSALPVLFPPMQVDGSWYVDGGLRQNTPLRPMLRVGATRALVVGLKMGRVDEGPAIAEPITPNLPFLLGKTFNALMLDPVERDLDDAVRTNQVLAWGQRTFGADFFVRSREDLGLRPVKIAFLKPKEDLGRVAAETFASRPPHASAQVRWLLHFVADRANNTESDLLSYLYFDREYTAQLERLGWEDARDRREELVALIDGPD